MKHSESIKNLAKALQLFQLKVGKVNKDATNPFFKNKYASLANILDTIQIPLQESGLTFSQLPEGEHQLTTILVHTESGEYLESTYAMAPTKNDPQGIGSTITYQRRYALAAILGLNIDDDDDGNAGSVAPENKSEPVEDNRPWLSEKALEQAIERIQAGEKDVIEKVKKAFKVRKSYMTELENATKQIA